MGVGDRFGSVDGVLEGWGGERMEVDVQVRCVGPDLAILFNWCICTEFRPQVSSVGAAECE